MTAEKPAETALRSAKTAVSVKSVSVTTASAKTATSAVTVQLFAATETDVNAVPSFVKAAAMPAATVRSSAKAAENYAKTALPMTPAGVKTAVSAVTV